MSNHLNETERIKLGSFYTPKKYVDIAYSMLSKNELNNFHIIDPAAGYGDFLKDKSNFFGFDVDESAVKIARKKFTKALIESRNTLNTTFDFKGDKIFIGNPPYNNLSSLYKKGEKGSFEILPQYKSRDLGISFMKMMAFHEPKKIVILHPLAFLIKKSNYSQLKSFFKKYSLENAYILSSSVFEDASKTTPFPVVIASYKQQENGQTFKEIQDFPMQLDEGGTIIFSELSTMDKNFIRKYPQKNQAKTKNMFYTMRDNNALSRNATWLKHENSGTVFVADEDIWKYNYVHLFKQWFKNNQIKAWLIGNCEPILIKNINKYRNKLSKMEISNQTKIEIDNDLTIAFNKWYNTKK